jgi:hypothetical protein
LSGSSNAAKAFGHFCGLAAGWIVWMSIGGIPGLLTGAVALGIVWGFITSLSSSVARGD